METDNTHRVSAIYHTEALAQEALARLRAAGFSNPQLRVIGPDYAKGKAAADLKPEKSESNGFLKHVIKDTLLGVGAGGAMGAAGSAALAATHMAVFMTNPVVGAIVTGYSAGVGGVLGALKSASFDENTFLQTAQHALERGYWIVVVHSHSREQQDQAGELLAIDADAVSDE